MFVAQGYSLLSGESRRDGMFTPERTLVATKRLAHNVPTELRGGMGWNPSFYKHAAPPELKTLANSSLNSIK